MALAELYYVNDERLFVEPTQLPDDYLQLRAMVAHTAQQLSERHSDTLKIGVKDLFRVAFGIVGEEVADNSTRHKLQNFFLGPVVETRYMTGALSGNNATTRMYVPSPSRETVQKNSVFQEPMATYLARQALKGRLDDLDEQLELNATENAGALFRTMTGGKRRNFTPMEAELAVSSLLPLVDTDVQTTLSMGYTEYVQELPKNRLTVRHL